MTLIRCWQDNDKNCVCSFILPLTVCFSLTLTLPLFISFSGWDTLNAIRCTRYARITCTLFSDTTLHTLRLTHLPTLCSPSLTHSVSCLYLVPAFCALSIHFTLGLFGLMWNWITHFCVAPSRTPSPLPNCFFSISKMITFCSPHCGPWYSEPVTAPPPSPWVAPFLARMRDNLIDEFRFCCCCCCCCHNALVSIAVSLLLRCNFLLYSLISFVSFALLLSGSGSCKILTVNCVFRQGYSGSAWRGGEVGEGEVCVCVCICCICIRICCIICVAWKIANATRNDSCQIASNRHVQVVATKKKREVMGEGKEKEKGRGGCVGQARVG